MAIPAVRRDLSLKILIDNGSYQFGNLGDWAMLKVMVERCEALFPGSEIAVLGNPERLRALMPKVNPIDVSGRHMLLGSGCLLGRLSPHLGKVDRFCSNIYPRVTHPMVSLKVKIRGVWADVVEQFRETLHGSDLVLASGGGFMADIFPGMVEDVGSLLKTAQAMGTPTAMLGQGLGPLSDPKLFRMASSSMKNVGLLSLREGLLGPATAARLGVPVSRTKVTGDDAIELAYNARKSCLGKMLGVNVRVSRYSGMDNKLLSDIASVLRRSIEELSADATPLPISFYAHENDFGQSARLIGSGREQMPRELKEPSAVIDLIGSCRVVVTGSYHAGVFALSQGIPVIGLCNSGYYRSKFYGLANQFGPSCRVISFDEKSSLKSLAAQLRIAWEQADKGRSELLSRAERQITLSRLAYQQLAFLVN